MKSPPAAGTCRAGRVHAALIQPVPGTASTLPRGLEHRDATLPAAGRAIIGVLTQADARPPTACALLRLIMTRRIIGHSYFRFLYKKTKPIMSRKAPSAESTVW
jgi:hypothetical protein